jgi:hypothetical protein
MSKTDADSSFSSLIDDSSALIPERVTTTAVQEDDSDSEDETPTSVITRTPGKRRGRRQTMTSKKAGTKKANNNSKASSSAEQSESSSNPLIKALSDLNFAEANSILTSTPSLASGVDTQGYLPLHHAVFLSAPLALIQNIIKAYPIGIYIPDPMDKCLPLHLAAEGVGY